MYWKLSILGFIFMVFVFLKVKRRVFSEAKSIFWMLAGLVATVLPLYPVVLVKVSEALGVLYAPSILFTLGIGFVCLIVFRQEQDISILTEHVKELAQRNALLQERISRLDRGVPDSEAGDI